MTPLRKKLIEKDKERAVKLVKEERIMEFFQTVLVNLEQQVELIQKSLQEEYKDAQQKTSQLEALFLELDERNDYYSALLGELILRATFLSMDRLHLLMARESFEAVMERIERVAHRLNLLFLPEWVTHHLIELTKILRGMLRVVINWIDPTTPHSPRDDQQIHVLENRADQLHRSFLKQLYSSTDMTFQVFRQAEVLDQLLEDTIDQLEILAKRLHLILEEYKIALQPLPHYLG